MSHDTASFPVLEGFDPFSQEFLSNPVPTIKRAQETKPVFYYPPLRMWVVTRYDDICRAARDWETFSSKATGFVPPPADLKDKIPDNYLAYHFISLYQERSHDPDTEQMLRWMSIMEDGITSDPAFWPDWLDSVDKVLEQLPAPGSPLGSRPSG